MKNYEKVYKKALEKIREGLQPLQDGTKISGVTRAFLEEVFPELKESEDERIRKGLIKALGTIGKRNWGGIDVFESIAWLEKQKNCIKLSDSAYTSKKDVIEFANKYSHTVWEKLMDNFKKNENYSIGCNDVSDIVLNAIINTYNWLEKQGEQKVPSVEFKAKDWYVSKVDGKIHNINISSEKQGEKKPTWSGEDERMVEEILDAIEAAEYEMALNMSDVRQWLKNLKQRLS